MDAILTIWDGLLPETRGYVVQIVPAVLGALIVVWQIGRQARYAIEQNRDAERTKLKLRIFEELEERLEAAMASQADLMSFVRHFVASVRLTQDLRLHDIAWGPPTTRLDEYVKLSNDAGKAALDLHILLDRWHVIDQRADVFGLSVSWALHDVREAQGPYWNDVVRHFPNEVTAGDIHWTEPTGDRFDRVVEITESFSQRAMELTNYYHDISIELKRLLLGDLFGESVKYREPLDPNAVVIRLDRYDELQKYYRESTRMGQEQRRAEETNMASMAGDDSRSDKASNSNDR